MTTRERNRRNDVIFCALCGGALGGWAFGFLGLAAGAVLGWFLSGAFQ